MKRLAGGCLILTLLGPGVKAQAPEQYQWKNRLILLYTPDLENADYQRQSEVLKKAGDGLEERKGLLFTITPEGYARGLEPRELKQGALPGRYDIDPSKGFRLLLIGLDGGVKLRSDRFTSVGDLWALIDAMPMRREELRRKGKKRR